MRIASRVGAALAALVLLAVGICGIVNAVSGGAPMPARRGPPSLAGNRYKVAILGDAQKGLANLANLLADVKREGADFVLQTGDLVSNNDEGHYRLAALYLQRAQLAVPFVAIPGNHDVKGGTGRFTDELGPLEWSFAVGEVGFLGINNALGEIPVPAALDRRIGLLPAGCEVVLAMHVPPFNVKGETLPGWQPFVDWLGRSRVRYLFCGQVHDYVRRQIGNTIVIANGVGGDYESWQLRQKVYATILEVDGRKLSDRAIERAPEHGFVENLEHLAIGHVAEAFRRKGWLCWPAVGLLLGWVLAILGRLRKKAEA